MVDKFLLNGFYLNLVGFLQHSRSEIAVVAHETALPGTQHKSEWSLECRIQQMETSGLDLMEGGWDTSGPTIHS